MFKNTQATLLLGYILVLELAIAGWLWGDAKLYAFAGVNFLLLLVWFFLSKNSTSAKKTLDSSFVREKSRFEEKTFDQWVVEDPQKSEKSETSVLSESNIENIKIKINKSKSRTQKQGSAILRLLVFVLAVIAFGGILMLTRDMFDFGAVVVAALAMFLFIFVVFKGFNLWQKPLFASIYALSFLLVGIAALGALFVNDDNRGKGAIKNQISTFFAGMRGEVLDTQGEIPQNENPTLTDSGSGIEISGEVLNVDFSETANLSGLEEGLVVINSGNRVEDLSWTHLTGITQGLISTGSRQTGDSISSVWPSLDTSDAIINKSSTQQLTILEAIKYLLKEYQIPLSNSKSVSFSYVSKNSEDYPYMKTALEKKMIGSTTNPETIVSCDVYIVMKGLAQNWPVLKATDVKQAYRNYAREKGQLNACSQGAKLTVANL